MKAKTVYIADDGSQWDTPDAAQKRDALVAKVDAAMAGLPGLPKRAGERVSVPVEAVRSARARIVELCREELPSVAVFQHPPEEIHPFSIAGRILDDHGGPLNRAWHWFMCYADGYLYEQPFFALNPDQWKPQEGL